MTRLPAMDEARLSEIEANFHRLALDEDMPNAEWDELQLAVLSAYPALTAEIRRLWADNKWTTEYDPWDRPGSD